LGGSYHGRANGTVADAAFFSTQWSKPISTGLGGVALTCDHEIAARIAEVISGFPRPGFAQQTMLGAQLLVQPLVNHPPLYYPLVGVYRFLTQRMGLSVGSSVPQELARGDMPDGYCQQMGRLQRGIWNRRISSLATTVANRQGVARHYDEIVAETGIVPPARPAFAEHAMLRYAVRVADKRLVLETARRHRMPVGDWFSSPLHPLECGWQQWGYEPGQCPLAEKACAELVNFFTDRALPAEGMMRLLAGQALPRSERWAA
jgi:dTDP-4-amino-4,6-dideoxygalactose transaminase